MSGRANHRGDSTVCTRQGDRAKNSLREREEAAEALATRITRIQFQPKAQIAAGRFPLPTTEEWGEGKGEGIPIRWKLPFSSALLPARAAQGEGKRLASCKSAKFDPKCSSGRPFKSVIPLHFANTDLELLIPGRFPLRLRHEVFFVSFPVLDGVQTRPVRNGDADAIGVANGFDAEEAGLLRSEREHFAGHFSVVIVVTSRPLRSEDDRVVGCKCGSDPVHVFRKSIIGEGRILPSGKLGRRHCVPPVVHLRFSSNSL